MGDIDWHSHIYSGEDAARLAGFEPVTLRAMFSRGHFRVMDKDDERRQVAKGHYRYSLRSISGYAAARQLIAAGLHPRDAFEATIIFAYTGDEHRRPGDVYDIHEYGYTFLVWDPSTKNSRIFTAGHTLPFAEVFGPRSIEHSSGIVTLICLNHVVDGVINRIVELGPG